MIYNILSHLFNNYFYLNNYHFVMLYYSFQRHPAMINDCKGNCHLILTYYSNMRHRLSCALILWATTLAFGMFFGGGL